MTAQKKSSSSSHRYLLSLFFLSTGLPTTRQNYARQGSLLKKLLSDGYTDEMIDVCLTHMLHNKEDYVRVKSLAYLPFIYEALMSKIAEEKEKEEMNGIVPVDAVPLSSNATKSEKFGKGGLRGDDYDWWLL